ncbi:MAG: DUF6057 family protein, partial [Bacteroidales bacterium]|nr:DUF6057 family protein [Bacteroidales bacterium]
YYYLPVGLLVTLVMGLLIGAGASFYKPENIVIYLLYCGFFGIISYLIAGPVGLYILVQVCIIDILGSRKLVKLAYVLPLLFIIPVAYLLFNRDLTLWSSFTGPFDVEMINGVPGVFFIGLLIPVLLLVLFEGLIPLLVGINQTKHRIVNRIGIIAVLIILVYTSWTSIDIETRSIVQIEQASFNDDWQEVLELGDYQLCSNRIVQYQVNRALYYRGMLLNYLFKYPQLFGEKGIFIEDIDASRAGLILTDFYYDLGFANEARHWSNEAHSAFVRHPIVLKRMVMTYGAMGSERTALKYNKVLSKSGLYRDWSDSISTLIKEDRFRKEPQVQSFIRNNPKYNFFSNPTDPYKNLSNFYKQNPNNHLAFEYLMSANLFRHDVRQIIKHLPDFRRFAYKKLPRAIEEAVLIYLAQSQEKNVNLYGFTIDEQTRNEFQDYQRRRASSSSKEQAMSQLVMYNHTYWYYVMFTSPLAK